MVHAASKCAMRPSLMHIFDEKDNVTDSFRERLVLLANRAVDAFTGRACVVLALASALGTRLTMKSHCGHGDP